MQILFILLNVIGPVALVAMVGCVWGLKRLPFDSRNFSMIATYIGTPCLVVDSLRESGLNLSDLSGIGFGAAACVLIALALGAATVALARESYTAFLPATTFSNCGNMGLPLALFAFGPRGLGLAIAYFAVHGVFTFTIGQGLAARRFSLLEVLFSPLIWATLIGGALSATGMALPSALGRAVHILAGVTIPMMLMALGYSLTQLKAKSWVWPVTISLVRLVGGFAIGWGVAYALGMTGAPRGVMILESGMPVAVYNYMFAARYDNRPEDVAGLVVISTLLAIPLLPFFLWTVM